MKNLKSTVFLIITLLFFMTHLKAQENKQTSIKKNKENSGILNASEASQQSKISIDKGMPNRISMNVTVPKQTQGATFGEKVNSGKINVTLVEGGCIVLFSSNEGFRINTKNNTISELSKSECQTFGERINAGLQSAGGAISQGASLVGGALPGGSIISATVSSVGNLANGNGGAASTAYAASGKISQSDSEKTNFKIQDDANDVILELTNGEYQLEFVIIEKATSGLKDTLKTQVRIGFSVENGLFKSKHDTVKNSISNIR